MLLFFSFFFLIKSKCKKINFLNLDTNLNLIEKVATCYMNIILIVFDKHLHFFSNKTSKQANMGRIINHG